MSSPSSEEPRQYIHFTIVDQHLRALVPVDQVDAFYADPGSLIHGDRPFRCRRKPMSSHRAMRVWARRQGIRLGQRGPVPKWVRNLFIEDRRPCDQWFNAVMARTTTVLLSDDISGEPDAQTYKFSLGMTPTRST